MRLQFAGSNLTLIREEHDPKFYGVKEAKGESNLFHWLKKQLAQQHPDVPKNFPSQWIKKRMWKDGHMVDAMQQYLRTQKPVFTKDGIGFYLCIHNPMWAIQGADFYWNQGSVRLITEIITICEPELTTADPACIAEQSQKAWEQIGKDLEIQ